MADFLLPDNQRPIDEGATPHLSLILKDPDTGSLITSASILTLTFTLWWVDRAGVSRTINSRKVQNVNGANQGSFGSTNGQFDLYMVAADATMQNPDLEVSEEEHKFRLDWTYTSSNGNRGGSYNDYFVVRRKQVTV